MPTRSRRKSENTFERVSIDSTTVPVHGDEESISNEIALRAYELYCERGREDGHDLDDWLRAERELRRRVSHVVDVNVPAESAYVSA